MCTIICKPTLSLAVHCVRRQLCCLSEASGLSLDPSMCQIDGDEEEHEMGDTPVLVALKE